MTEIIPTHADIAPHALLRAADDLDWHPGCAEPWVADVLASLLRANATRVAIEIGGFEGYTSRHLQRALSTLPWQKSLTVCEIDHDRARATRRTLCRDGICGYVKVMCADSLDWIPTLDAESVDFVWLDGCHEKPHVYRELRALVPKMAPGGLLCGHDVFGSTDLQEVFARVAVETGWRSMSLDLPMLGPAGGIGCLQRPR